MTSSKADELPWFHCFPGRLLGSLSAMAAEEQHVFLITLLRIYETRGPIRDDDRALARRTGLSVRKVTAAKARLFETGKLLTTGDGAYTNPFAQAEIEIGERDAKALSAKRSVAGKSRWQKLKENQRAHDASAVHAQCNTVQTDADSDLEVDEGSHGEAMTPSSPLNPPSKNTFVPSGEGTDATVEAKIEAKPKAKRNRKAYTEAFETFWKGYPTDANMSKAETLDEWRKLSEDDHELAIRSLPAFRDYCHKHKDYRIVHACKYLKVRRFEGHAQSANGAAKLSDIITVIPGTTDWHRLRALLVDAKDLRRLRDMNDFAAQGAQYPVPPEFRQTFH